MELLTLMIVEDHKWTREGLAKTIPWKEEGLALRDVCSDGREAWEILRNSPADLIITDICMDGMDGLELTRCVKQKYPQTEIILISAYEEFKYAQQAVNLGASAYIIKPIETKELLEKVRAGVLRINGKRTSELQSREYRKSALAKALNDCLFGDSGEAAASAGEELGAQLRLAGFGAKPHAFVFLLEGLPGGKGRAAARDAVNASGPDLLAFESGNICVGLYLMKDATDYYQFRQKLLSALAPLQGDFRVCAGTAAAGPEELRASYASALSLLNRCFLKDLTGLRLAKEEEDTPPRAAALPEPELLAEAAAERRDARGSLSALREAWIQAQTPRAEVLAYCRRCLAALEKLAERSGIPMQRIYNTCGEPQSFLQCGSLGGILESLRQVTQELTELLAARGGAAVRPVVAKAAEYIRAEYSRKEISLASAAEKLGLNYSYLSKCFKEDMGVNFIDYLNRYRVEMAKKYLRTTDLKIYEICSLVGIDSRYFNHLFREYVGISPHEYKISPGTPKQNP